MLDHNMKNISLANAVKFVVDNRGRTAPTQDTGIPLIATNCINNATLYPTKERPRYVSDETYENWFRSHPQPGDIILTNKGSQNGAVCLVPDPVDFCIAQDMVALRSDESKIDPLYLFAALRSSLVQQRIKDLNVDAVIPHFKKSDFNKLFIPLPDRKNQEFIGKLYFEFSHKIELNRQINQTLEQIAQTIFKSWFVDFEPVKAKIEAKAAGRDPERAAMCAISGKLEPELDQLSPEQRQHLAATAALFPDELVESDLGLIPEGWEVLSLGEATSYLGRGISPKYIEDGGVVVLNQKCVRDNVLDVSKARRHDINQRKIDGRELYIGDVLVNSTGVGTLGRVAQILDLSETTIVDSHVTVVRAKSPLTWNYLGLDMIRRQAEIEQLGEGSTGQTELNRGKLAGLKLTVPSFAALQAFDAIAVPFRQQLAANLRQVDTFAALRDTLLPKLLSGELSVAKAESQA